MGRLFELLIALFLLIHIPITLFGDAQAGEEALCALKPVELLSRVRTGAGRTRTTPTLSHAVLGPEWFHPRMLDVMKWYLGTHHDPLVRFQGGSGVLKGEFVRGGVLCLLVASSLRAVALLRDAGRHRRRPLFQHIPPADR